MEDANFQEDENGDEDLTFGDLTVTVAEMMLKMMMSINRRMMVTISMKMMVTFNMTMMVTISISMMVMV